eukprot:CAMPEP_0115011128 /NCGR_PEP_ID=MMETSP0216-20121206/23789_1 /TAXON_ID=223996 /ORGANISM="Protocruzia adherens, Strain Boccale" /LENGTH=307 /DNA_ID=CAMNT_0002379599 /DNA_START=38 /DNA_END=959 /DNA_ORIENTATION=+
MDGKAMDFSKKPRAFVCYICGREYGTASLGIHQKRCAKRWEEEQALKPKKDRKPLPKAPAELQNIKGMSSADIDKFNNDREPLAGDRGFGDLRASWFGVLVASALLSVLGLIVAAFAEVAMRKSMSKFNNSPLKSASSKAATINPRTLNNADATKTPNQLARKSPNPRSPANGSRATTSTVTSGLSSAGGLNQKMRATLNTPGTSSSSTSNLSRSPRNTGKSIMSSTGKQNELGDGGSGPAGSGMNKAVLKEIVRVFAPNVDERLTAFLRRVYPEVFALAVATNISPVTDFAVCAELRGLRKALETD